MRRSRADGIGSGIVTGRPISTRQVVDPDHVTVDPDLGHVNGCEIDRDREIVIACRGVMSDHSTSDHIVAHAPHLSTRKEDMDHRTLGSEGSVYLKFSKGVNNCKPHLEPNGCKFRWKKPSQSLVPNLPSGNMILIIDLMGLTQLPQNV